jgi:hypothetical protein
MSAPFNLGAESMDKRLRAKLSLPEVFAVMIALSVALAFIYYHQRGWMDLIDFDAYLRGAQGDFRYFFYAYWFLPVVSFLSFLPFTISAVLWDVIGIFSLVIACRVFDAKPLPIILSYQVLYILFYGQITLWLIGGLALAWWAMAHDKWYLAGLGFVLAATKYQVGIFFDLVLWLAATRDWQTRAKALALPIAVSIITTIVYPHWLSGTIASIATSHPNDAASVSLWRWVGPWGLLLLIPPLFVKDKNRRLILLLIAAILASPYYQQADLVCLFLFLPTPIILLGYLGVGFVWFGYGALQVLTLIPIIAYGYFLFPDIARKLRTGSDGWW